MRENTAADGHPAIHRVGVVSDTHGLLRASVLPHLEGVDHILHAGDVGDPAILVRLASIAPTTAIRGNIDRAGRCAELPATEMLTLFGRTIYMLHDLAELDLAPHAAGVDLVVSGHSHAPRTEDRQGVLYLNPGSIGPRRFKLPISLALVEFGRTMDVRFVTLSE